MNMNSPLLSLVIANFGSISWCHCVVNEDIILGWVTLLLMVVFLMICYWEWCCDTGGLVHSISVILAVCLSGIILEVLV